MVRSVRWPGMALAALLVTGLAALAASVAHPAVAAAAPTTPARLAVPNVPGAAIFDDCDLGGASIILDNDDPDANTFVVTKNSEQFVSLELEPGETTQVVMPLNEGERADIAIKVDGTVVASATIVHTCLQATATIAEDCAGDGARVTLWNGGAGSVEFLVTRNGFLAVDPQVLGPGESRVVSVAMDEDTTAEIVVSAEGTELARSTVTRDCQRPALVSVTGDCAAGGAIVVLRNDGPNAAFVELGSGGQPNGPLVAVPGGGTATGVVPMPVGATATITAWSNGAVLGRATVTRTCAQVLPPPPPPATNTTTPPDTCAGTTGRPECQDVLGVKLTRTGGSLPATGVGVKPLTATAGLLLLVGGLLVAFPARPVRRAHRNTT